MTTSWRVRPCPGRGAARVAARRPRADGSALGLVVRPRPPLRHAKGGPLAPDRGRRGGRRRPPQCGLHEAARPITVSTPYGTDIRGPSDHGPCPGRRLVSILAMASNLRDRLIERASAALRDAEREFRGGRDETRRAELEARIGDLRERLEDLRAGVWSRRVLDGLDESSRPPMLEGARPSLARWSKARATRTPSAVSSASSCEPSSGSWSKVPNRSGQRLDR
jgi:hypothetical protein